MTAFIPWGISYVLHFFDGGQVLCSFFHTSLEKLSWLIINTWRLVDYVQLFPPLPILLVVMQVSCLDGMMFVSEGSCTGPSSTQFIG